MRRLEVNYKTVHYRSYILVMSVNSTETTFCQAGLVKPPLKVQSVDPLGLREGQATLITSYNRIVIPLMVGPYV